MTRRKTRTGEAPRAPLERPISLRFKHFGDFIDEQAGNVSTGGMFVRTRNPRPVGSVFEFELRLGEERPLLSGKAQVAWVRRRGSGPDEPSGMGVRFVELTDESRRHIAELVADYESRAGHPFEVETSAPPAEAADGEATETAPAGAAAPLREPPEAETPNPPEARTPSPPEARTPNPPEAKTPVPQEAEAPPPVATSGAPAPAPAGRAMSARAGSRRRRLPWILLAIVLLAALTAALWPRPTPVSQAAAVSATPSTSDEPPAPAPGPATTSAPDASPQLRLVEAWSRAWSEQRVDDYFAAYSPRFDPPQGLDRAAWELQRRSRILAPSWIVVDLALIELEELDPGRSRVRFVQAYESDSYSDVVRKTLELERTDDGWKILRETVEP